MSAKGKVLLVNPRMCPPKAVRMPLSLLALGAALEGEHDYRIVDGNLDGDAVGTVLRELAAEPCDLVGITVMPGPQVAPAIEISAAVRDAFPRIPIAWGDTSPLSTPLRRSTLPTSTTSPAARGRRRSASWWVRCGMARRTWPA